MANDENLIPGNKRTQKEARENGRKGGIKSGKVRKRKKELKEQLQMGIDILTKQVIKGQKLNKEQKQILEASDVLVFNVLNIAMSKKTKPETRLKALQAIWDRIHGKPMQEFKGTNRNINTDIDMTEFSDDVLESMSNMSNDEVKMLLTNVTKKTKTKRTRKKKG